MTNNYIFENFSNSSNYRKQLIDFLKHNANIEHGGYKLFDGTYSHMLQIPEELADFIIYLKKYEKKYGKIKNFLEIGFGNGSTNTILNKFFNFEKIVVLDNFSANTSNNTLIANFQHKNMIIFCGDSTSPWCVENVNKMAPFDLIFIDGNHTSPYIQKDFENYSKMGTSKSLVAFHDIASSEWPDISNYWSIIKKNKKLNFKEFICKNYKINFGIGITSRQKL